MSSAAVASKVVAVSSAATVSDVAEVALVAVSCVSNVAGVPYAVLCVAVVLYAAVVS